MAQCRAVHREFAQRRSVKHGRHPQHFRRRAAGTYPAIGICVAQSRVDQGVRMLRRPKIRWITQTGWLRIQRKHSGPSCWRCRVSARKLPMPFCFMRSVILYLSLTNICGELSHAMSWLPRTQRYTELQSLGDRAVASGTAEETARHANELHALIVEVGKRHCGTNPRCEGCPLQPFLP